MDDLQTIVAELLRTGLTHQALADRVPCSASTIGMLATGHRGARTSYPIEKQLRDLHAARVKPEAR